MIRASFALFAVLSAPALAADASAIAGTWNVTSTTTSWSTCPAAPPESTPGYVSAYVWIVSVDVLGNISVSVQGSTAFPVLYGNMTGTKITLQGDGVRSDLALMAKKQTKTWFSLDSSSGELVGIRRYSAASSC